MASLEIELLRNGIRKKCPVCGQGKLFRRWSKILEQCPRCHLQFDRIEGHSLGALGLNTIATVIVLFVTVTVSVVLTIPTIPVLPLVSLCLGVAIVMPILFAPFSWTLWTAIDLAMRPPTPGEIDAEFYARWNEKMSGSN